MKPVTSANIGSRQTSASGATYVALAAALAQRVDVLNQTGTDLEFRRGGSGATIVVQDGNGYGFEMGRDGDASGLQVRRLDQSNTQVTFTYELIVY